MPAQRKYPDELRERAVRMVLEIRQREGKGHGELAPGGPSAGRSSRGAAWLGQADRDRQRDAAGNHNGGSAAERGAGTRSS